MPKATEVSAVLSAEAARRGITIGQLTAELAESNADVMVLKHIRIPQPLADDVDAEAKARGLTMTEVIRDRIQRAPKHTTRVTNVKG